MCQDYVKKGASLHLMSCKQKKKEKSLIPPLCMGQNVGLHKSHKSIHLFLKEKPTEYI